MFEFFSSYSRQGCVIRYSDLFHSMEVGCQKHGRHLKNRKDSHSLKQEEKKKLFTEQNRVPTYALFRHYDVFWRVHR